MRSAPHAICPLRCSGSSIYVKRVVRRRWRVGRGGEGRGRDEHVSGWGAGRSRAIARNVLHFAQPQDVRSDGGSASCMMTVELSEVEPRCLQDRVTVLGLLGRARVGFMGPGSELSYHSQMKSKKNGMHISKGPRRRISPGEVVCSPLSSVPSS